MFKGISSSKIVGSLGDDGGAGVKRVVGLTASGATVKRCCRNGLASLASFSVLVTLMGLVVFAGLVAFFGLAPLRAAASGRRPPMAFLMDSALFDKKFCS